MADCFERQKNRTDHSVWFCGSTAFYRISGQTQGDENVCRVEVWLSGKSRILWAYCDSGNLLRDPDSGAPVSVLEQELFEQLPQDTVRKKEISYRTIRREGSMMVVLLDRMDIWQKGTKSRFSNRKSDYRKGR